MKLRNLHRDDAERMLEWMHDIDIVQDLQTNFLGKTISDCLSFIDASAADKENLNLAITDDTGIYMGTVSLKHINYINKNAEFAIVVRRIAMGKGYSIYGMNAILQLAKKELGLDQVYWCVSPKNTRAIRFYQKYNFKLCTENTNAFKQFYQPDSYNELIWYSVRL